MKRYIFQAAAILVLAASPAFAHTDTGTTTGFSAGFVHPVGGLDHMLAMIAVGILATQIGGKSLWLVPASFVGMMIIGGFIGMSGIAVPYVELGIVGSVVGLGCLIAAGQKMPTVVAMFLVGLMAVFHGHAHGTEMPVNVSGIEYGIGFVAATGILHIAGIGLSIIVQTIGRKAAPNALRLSGGIIAATGVTLFTI